MALQGSVTIGLQGSVAWCVNIRDIHAEMYLVPGHCFAEVFTLCLGDCDVTLWAHRKVWPSKR